ncbi:hypothetical protein H4R19_001030 [Coemansia spiralis]|nr:hypothetical protein H4R19_001030 [Coemansia spiralis]
MKYTTAVIKEYDEFVIVTGCRTHSYWTHNLNLLDITWSCLNRLGQGAIYAPSLKHLAICQVSYLFSWAVFYDDNNSNSHSKTLAFQSLERLEFEYIDGYPQSERAINSTLPAFPKQLLFPKLQWLEVTGFLLNCPVMFHAQLPPRLWLMRLKCPARVARALGSTVTLPTAYFVTCEITADHVDEDSAPVTATNALLSGIRAMGTLSVEYLAQQVNCWADMEWGNATSLTITCTMGPIDILLVLSRVPQV